MTRLAIIIPTFNRKKLLEELIISINQQNNVPVPFKIIVVVDGSTDGTLEMLQAKFSDVIVVKGDGNWWWTKSINEGLKLAIKQNFDTFLLMNDDTFIKELFLKNYLSEYISNNHGVLGAISITNTEPNRIFYSGIKYVKWNIAKWKKYYPFFYPFSDQIRGIHPTFVIPGRGMLFNKEVVDKIGSFNDIHFPQYYADYDFSYRALKEGFNVNVSWNSPIYSYVKLTAKGSKVNSGFIAFLKGFLNPMVSQSLKRTYYFYKFHGGKTYIIGFLLHNMRLIMAYIVQKLRKDI